MHKDSVLAKPENNLEQLIEFEQALLALQIVPNIVNPCLKKTMMVGPKKFVGKNSNSQVHQHTNKKTIITDFDTMSMLQSTKTGTTQANSKLRSRLSTSAIRRLPEDFSG